MTSLDGFALTRSSSGLSGSSWIYLSDWILALVLGLAFTFYFPRLVAFVLSTVLRVVTWKTFKTRILMEAFRVSPLGGRITARNIVITNSDYTISILRLNLTWRYWLFSMTRISSYYLSDHGEASENEFLSDELNSKLSSALQLLMDGFEVFMYNRTVAYDNILEQLKKHDSGPVRVESLASEPDNKSMSLSATVEVKSTGRWFRMLLALLPLRLRIKRGVFVLGNATTPSILVASCKVGAAVFDISNAPCKLDEYRTSFEMHMNKFQVSLKPNITYEPGAYKSKDVFPKTSSDPEKQRDGLRSRILRKTLDRLNIRKPPPITASMDWHGLRRYVEDTGEERLMDLSEVEEYGKYSLVLDSTTTTMTYYYDVPGRHPPRNARMDSAKHPEFGVDLTISDATIHYGSWADRQRGPLQSLLFPVLQRDSVISEVSWAPHDPRVYAGFSLKIAFQGETVFRLPTREFSKDREVLAHHGHNKEHKIARPFGWLEFKVASNSYIRSFTSYLSDAKGWPNTLSVHLMLPEIRTSVNHNILLTADEHHMECDIGFPLKWDAKCIWTFAMRSQNARLFFLREHVYLFSDIVADFALGPGVPYENYRPFDYKLDWSIENFNLFFNVNDHNIVNDPLDFSTNKYLLFRGEKLDIGVFIPIKGLFLESSSIEYKIETDSFDVILEVPRWHTVGQFMGSDRQMGSSGCFKVTGSYTYYNAVELNRSNYVVINAIGDNVSLLFHGYLIRYLFTLRENYFGDYKKFKTFEEYTNGLNLDRQDLESSTLASSASEEDPDYWNMLKAENDVNVLFTFSVRNGLIVVPCQLFDHAHHLGLSFDYLDVEIDLNHYFMDLEADYSPACGYYFEPKRLKDRSVVFDVPSYKKLLNIDNPEFIIDGFSVHTHRMFGLAPELTTYQCKWDFFSGGIYINGGPASLVGLGALIKCFATGFKDLENTLIYQIPIVYDMANFTFRCSVISINLKCGDSDMFFQVEISDLLLGFNDIANLRYSSRLIVSLPSITIKIVTDDACKEPEALISTSLVFTNFCQKAKMLEHRRTQQLYVRRSDAPTHRVPFLLFPENKDDTYRHARGCLLPTTSAPIASVPLTEESKGFPDDISIDDLYSLSSFNGIDDDFPTTNYDDRHFSPRSRPISGFKNDSYVLEFDAIDVSLTPKAAMGFAKLCLSSQNLDLKFLIDKLHIETISRLSKRIFGVSMVDDLRFTCPEINLKVSLSSSTSDSQAQMSMKVSEPSLVFSTRADRDNTTSDGSIAADLSLACHVRHIFASIHRPSCFSPGALVEASELEFWFTSASDFTTINFSSSEDIKLRADVSDLEWVLQFVRELLDQFAPALEIFEIRNIAASSWKKELAFMLSTKGRSKLFADPSVLVKPANNLRYTENHVRNFESWKLVTKMRYMLSELEGYETERARFLNREWQNSDSSYQETVDAFNQWRSWESHHEHRAQFFRHLFGMSNESSIKQLRLLANLAGLEVILTESSNKGDSLKFNDVSISSFVNDQTSILSSGQHENPKKSTAMIVGIKSVESTLSLTTLRAISKLRTSKLSSDSIQLETTGKTSEELFFLMLHSRSADIHMRTHSACISFQGQDLATILQAAKGPDDPFVNIGSAFKSLSLVLSNEDVVLAQLAIMNLNVVASDYVIKSGGFKHLDSNISEIVFHLHDKGNITQDVLGQLINEDFREIQEVLRLPGKDGRENKREDLTQTDISDFLAKILIGEILLNSDLLKPVVIKSNLKNLEMSLSHLEDHFIGALGYSGISLEIRLLGMKLLHSEHTQAGIGMRAICLDGHWLVSGEIHLGYLKIENPHILQTLQKVLAHIPEVKNRINGFLRLLELEDKSTTDKPQHTNSPKPIHLRMSISMNYLGLVALRELTRYSFEVEGVSLFLSNLKRLENDFKLIDPWFELEVPALRVSVFDPSYPLGLAKILDLNFSTKVKNEVDNNGKLDRSLQIESEYLRVCLSPRSLFRVVELSDGVGKILRNAPTATKGLQDADDVSNERGHGVPKKSNFNFSSVHVLSHNFCVGWIFGSSYKDYPGFILGAKSLFAATDYNLGKLSLVGGYLSVANGSTSSSFYSTGSDVHHLNRAFMPKLQINYCVDAAKALHIVLKGDELDVRFMTNSIVIIERAIACAGEVQDFFERRRNMQKRAGIFREMPMATKQLRLSGKPSGHSWDAKFSSIELRSFFAGSRVHAYRLSEGDSQTPAKLLLNSPAVQVVTFYKHVHDAPKKHIVRIEFLMTKSDNTLDSTCVPVIMDIVEAVKSALGGPKKQRSVTDEARNVKTLNSAPNQDESIANLLDDIDFVAGIIIEEQRFSLSCEPTAKVAAVVQYKGASFQACSGTAGNIALTLRLNSLTAALQHQYAEERSGTVTMEQFVLSSNVVTKPTMTIQSSASIGGVSGYIKMSQLQDIDLFRDIWYPKKYRKSARETHDEAKKPLSLREVKQRSETTIRASLTFLVSNITMEFDLGAALGTAVVDIDRAWVVSQKVAQEFYEINFGSQTVMVGCEGRLGGFIELNQFFFKSNVEWKLNDTEFIGIPLVRLSGGFEEMNMKTSFDTHLFAVAGLRGWQCEAFNRKNGVNISKDHLYVMLKYESVDILLTSLAASNFYDIYSTISRMREERRTSYREILQDSSKTYTRPEFDLKDIIQVVKKLETKIEVKTGATRLFVYPQLFGDSRVLRIQLAKSSANFLQNEYELGVANEIELQLNNVRVSLSQIQGISLDDVKEKKVHELISDARGARGGGIVRFPKFMISMKTYQTYESKVVEYLFQSSFGGFVDIRWNLGSVNFVNQMYAAHKKALQSRRQYVTSNMAPLKDGAEVAHKILEAENYLDTDVDPFTTQHDIDEDFSKTMNRVISTSNFTYKALAPPVIGAPQLKELGNATPPLEWFGLHRNNFPDATHQFAIVSLQKLIHEIEHQYTKALRA